MKASRCFWHSKHGQVRFPDEATARAKGHHALWLAAVENRLYPHHCNGCGGWHVTRRMLSDVAPVTSQSTVDTTDILRGFEARTP